MTKNSNHRILMLEVKTVHTEKGIHGNTTEKANDNSLELKSKRTRQTRIYLEYAPSMTYPSRSFLLDVQAALYRESKNIKRWAQDTKYDDLIITYYLNNPIQRGTPEDCITLNYDFSDGKPDDLYLYLDVYCWREADG